MKRITIFSTSARRCFAAAVLLFWGLLPIIAGNTSTTYYYRATIYTNPSAGGKVYANDTGNQPNNGSYSNSTNNSPYRITGSESTTGDNGTKTLYLWAQANNGYVFDHWEDNNGNNISTSTNTSTGISFNSTNSGDAQRTQFYYTAVFMEQRGLVKVAVAETGRGSVSIDKPNNTNGQEITISAFPDASNGIKFAGWSKGNNSTIVSTENPWTFTATSGNNGTAGTYYAHFSDPPEQLYCRIMNRATGRFLTLYGTQKADQTTRVIGENTINDGFVFTNSLKMTSGEDEAKGNPMTVFLRISQSVSNGIAKEVDLKACGVEYVKDLVKEAKYSLTMENTTGGAVRIYANMSATISGTPYEFKSYLQDDGDSEFAVMKSVDNLTVEGLDWDIYVLDEDCITGSFGANTKRQFTQNGKYYTTMFSYFPYKLLDGVKAYYLPIHEENDIYDAETNTAHFKDIPLTNNEGIVPMNTAVVLESENPYDNTNNRLLPLKESDYHDLSFESNFLLGYNYVYGISNSNNTTIRGQYVPNDINKPDMFILSQLNGRLGWYYSKADHMTPNKAYIDVSALEEYIANHPNEARTIKFTFGDDNSGEATGVIAPNYADEVDGPLFDLNGRRVTNGDAYGLKKGIYISNGKKIVVK